MTNWLLLERRFHFNLKFYSIARGFIGINKSSDQLLIGCIGLIII